MALSVNQVIQRVRDIVGDPDGHRWSDARLIREINAAQLEFCKATKILRDTINIPIIEGQANYEIPNNLIILRAYFNKKPLKLISIYDLDKKIANWEDQKGIPTHIVFNMLNRSVVRLYPIPDFTNLTIDNNLPEELKYNLKITYIRYPNKVVNIKDELEIPEIYLEPLVLYITGMLFRSDTDNINRQYGIEQLQLYSQAIQEIKNQASLDFIRHPSNYKTSYRTPFEE